jgi:hypothetical protein
VLTCCGLVSIGGAIAAGIGIGRVDTDLAGAQRLARWSWILLAANLVLWILAIVIFIAVGASTSGFSTS